MQTIKFKKLIAATLVAFSFFISLLLGAVSAGVSARADTALNSFEARAVLDDLKGSTVDGKQFNLADYPMSESRQLKLLAFSEYCYSSDTEKQGDYALYAYVYNPRGLAFEKNEAANNLEFRVNGSGSYSKYSLKYLNKSSEDGLFYKFKVDLNDAQRVLILSSLTPASRVYDISGIELSDAEGNPVEYDVGNVYTYTGYAKGYGDANAPLSCRADGMMTLSLEVKPTFFRGSYTTGLGYYDRDTLHSVYFAVPNNIITDYGEMTAVRATWLNAMTNWGLVTGNKAFYSKALETAGVIVDPDGAFRGGDYAFRTTKNLNDANITPGTDAYYAAFNYPNDKAKAAYLIKRLPYVFYAENGDADTYNVPAEEIIQYMKNYTAKYPPSALIDGRYSPALFSRVDEDYTVIDIENTDTFNLRSQKLDSTWWEKLLGKKHVEAKEDFSNIQAIEAVDFEDVQKLSKLELCKKYYFNENDYTEFKAYCNTAVSENKTVYMFRYYTTVYTSAEVTEGLWKDGKAGGTLTATDTNAYTFREWVQLGFDVINLTFTKNNVSTVIPVIASPQDIAADAEHPVETTGDITNFWVYALIIAAVLTVIYIIIYFISKHAEKL